MPLRRLDDPDYAFEIRDAQRYQDFMQQVKPALQARRVHVIFERRAQDRRR